MPRHERKASYEEWVVSRIRGDRNEFLHTGELLRPPSYLSGMQTDWELTRRLEAMARNGALRRSGTRWYLAHGVTP